LRLRRSLSANFGLGISGDPQAALGLVAGCDTWYSVLAGTFPKAALAITGAAQAGHAGDRVDHVLS